MGGGWTKADPEEAALMLRAHERIRPIFEGMPSRLAFSVAGLWSTKIGASMNISEDMFVDFMRRNFRDSRIAEANRRALGSDASTVLDGDRRILLPFEQGDA